MHLHRHAFKIPSAAIAGIVLLSALQQLSGQGQPLTLQQALQRARASNPELQARQHQAAAADARIDTASALPDPKIQFTYFGESVETKNGPQEAIYSISQTLPWLTKLRTRRAQASYEAEEMDQLAIDTRTRLDEALTHAFTEAAYYQQAMQSSRANLQYLQDSRQIVEEQVRGGASLNALLRLEVEMERTRDQLDQFAQAQLTQRTRLAALMGIEVSELGELAAMPPPTTLEGWKLAQLEPALISNNPELNALQNRIQTANAQTELAKLERYPDITLGLNYIQIGNDGTNNSDAGRDPWNVSLAINLPIWEGKNRATILAAKQSERAAIKLQHNRRLQLKAELSASLAKHKDSLRRIQRYQQKLIPLAEQALENSQAAYQSGQITALEIIDSQRALLELKLSLQRVIADTLQAEAKIKRLTNPTF